MTQLEKIHEEYLQLISDQELLKEILTNFDRQSLQFIKIKDNVEEIGSRLSDDKKTQLINQNVKFQQKLKERKNKFYYDEI